MVELDYTGRVDAHYGRRDFAREILDTLRAAGKNLNALRPDDVAQLTHLNPRGKIATLELAKAAGLSHGMHVLDLGSGLGGPARTLAADIGCRVTGLDLTAELVRTATILTERTGLAGQVTFQQGDALDMPFPEASFDAVWTEQFTMHIPDKSRLYVQIHRVLRRGGRYAFREFMAGEVQPLLYPVGWARDPSISFLDEPDRVRSLIKRVGFDERHWEDVTPRPVVASQTAWSTDSSLPTGPQLFQGADYENNRRNMARNYAEDRLSLVQGVFERVEPAHIP